MKEELKGVECRAGKIKEMGFLPALAVRLKVLSIFLSLVESQLPAFPKLGLERTTPK